MLRVLHYVGKMDRGGMEALIMNIYRNIDREKYQFDFAVHGTRNGDYEEEIHQLGGSFHQFPHMRKDPAAYRKAWRNFWQAHKDEYVAFHMHTNSLANIIALEEAYKAQVPVRIVHSHSTFANRGKLQFLNNFLHKLHRGKVKKIATDLFACSEKAANWLYGGMTLGNHSVRLLKNGVDLKQFQFDPDVRAEVRKELGLEDNKVIIHVGAFLPVKNQKFLVEVMEAAYQKDNNVRCVLVGNGPLFGEIQQLVAEKNLSDVIRFLGIRRDVDRLLQAADLFVMPSLYEGLPVSLIEVQTSGLPALISDTITQEVKLKDNLAFMSLEEDVNVWADRLLENAQLPRIEDNESIVAAGYDVAGTVRAYIKLLES